MHPNDGRVVSRFIVSALRHEPIAIYGQGDQTRSFCFVDDLVEGILALMNSPSEFTGPINLGNPVETRIIDLAEGIIRLTNSRSTIVLEPSRSDDPKQRQPDISLARERLNWTPKTGLRDGLGRTIAYFDELLRLGG
jgi:UDP-glucuronate decarboxylase